MEREGVDNYICVFSLEGREGESTSWNVRKEGRAVREEQEEEE